MSQCEGCKLYPLGATDRVCIPPPSKDIRGCIISRDPTYEFLKPLRFYNMHFPLKQKNLFFDAPPCWLVKRIIRFIDLDKNSLEIINLRKFLDEQCFWTHLHKCPTHRVVKSDEKFQKKGDEDINRFPPFRYSNARYCGDSWFETEFDKYELKDKIIILLGKEVKKFFSQKVKSFFDVNGENVIHLPHPSSANCGKIGSWNHNTADREKIVREIDRLFTLINEK
jgi:hypothetical protein